MRNLVADGLGWFPGAGWQLGDQPDAAAGDGRRSERAGGMTAFAGAVCAYQVVRTADMARGEWSANKILFGTQMCTYNLYRSNKRKGFEGFWEVKSGLTTYAYMDRCGLVAQPFGCAQGRLLQRAQGWAGTPSSSACACELLRQTMLDRLRFLPCFLPPSLE
jgi:hypothetical protein